MSGEAPVMSVIVVNYNGRRWLDGCLAALEAQRGAPAFEVLVVDNGSTDGSAERTGAGARVYLARQNLGFAGGNNAGARLAHGAILAFLNNDTVPAPDWLACLHKAFVDRPDYSLITSRILFLHDPSTVDSAGDGYLRAGGAFKHGYGAAASLQQGSREVFGACGAAFAIHRDLFLQLGGFDESFFMVYEDVDLSYRARLMGHRCWYAAEATVLHAGSGTLGVASADAVFYGQRNLEWTWLKNTPAGLLIRTIGPHVVYSLAGLAHYARTGRLLPALRGKWAALAALGSILKARRDVQARATAEAGSVEALMERRWLARKRLEKAARRRDLTGPRPAGPS